MPETIEWDFILDKIKKEKCILLLGPELWLSKEGKPFEQLLLEQIESDDSKKQLSYYKKDGFFLFNSAEEKMHFGYKMEQLYQSECDDEVFHTISRLPFHLIISATPDLNLKRVFEKNNINHNFSFYDKTTAPEEVPEPTNEAPLIYNLLGNVEKWESLILTYDDLFDFLSEIMGDRELPTNLKNALKEADSLIFLGFKFEKWYVQLLLRILQLQMGKTKYAYNKAFDYETKCFCIEQFKIKFVDEDMHLFIRELYDKCEAEGLLRETGDEESVVSEQIENFIAQDKIEKAIQTAKAFFSGKGETDLVEDIILLEGRYNRLMRKINLGVLEESTSEVDHNKIKLALMELNKELKSLET